MFLYKILKKFSCSHHFLKFFGPWIKGRPCKKRIISLPRHLHTGPKMGCRTKNVDFFKVRDMLTIIQPRKKEHLTNVSSPLKTFYDHLRGCRDNLNFLDFWDFWYAYIGKSTHKCLWWNRPKVTKRGLTWFQIAISFFWLKIYPTMYILTENWSFRDFEKNKILNIYIFFWPKWP